MDEARRARLQAKLDAETLKGTLANKVRAPRPARRLPVFVRPPAGDDEKLNLEMPNPFPPRTHPRQVKMSSKSAAKTRNMVLDTHDANMFVTGDKPALPAPRSSRGSQSVTVNSTARSSRSTRAPPPKYAASLTGLPSEGGVTRKVGEQSNRDWAVMSRFEQEVYARQQAEIKAEERRAVAAQRRELDKQMSLIERRKERAKEEKAAMAAAVAADVERFKREEEAKRERQRGADEAVRAEQSAIMAALETRRLEAEAAKRAEEEAALVEITRQLEQERLEKAAKIEKLRKDAAVTMAFNREQDAIKARALRAEAEEDARKQAEYDALLEAQERQRAAALEEFHAKIAARAGKAGEAATAAREAKEREERDRNLRIQREKDAAQAQKDALAAAKRREATSAQLEMLETQLAMKAEERRRRREEEERYAAETAKRIAAAESADRAEKADRRAKAVANRLALEAQMTDKSERAKLAHDDFMDETELRMNTAILTQARAVVLDGEEF